MGATEVLASIFGVQNKDQQGFYRYKEGKALFGLCIESHIDLLVIWGVSFGI